jgi:hypothetical protein
MIASSLKFVAIDWKTFARGHGFQAVDDFTPLPLCALCDVPAAPAA